MISVKRIALTSICLVYLFCLPVQSILLGGFLNRTYEVIALTLCFAAGIPTLALYRGIRIPFWQAIANLLVSITLPILIIYQRDLDNDHSTGGGWLVVGCTILLTATAVRQHPWISVFGLAALLTQVIYQYGFAAIINKGLAGAIVFVLAGLGVSRGINRANKESDVYRERQAASLARVAAIEAAEATRTQRLQEVLSSAIPMLERIANQDRPLSKAEKEKAKLLELSLRDEIRGKGLLSAQVRAEITRLRTLGVEVTVLDEGGMEDISLAEKEELLGKAIEALQVIKAGRVTLRSPRGEKFRLTVVATIAGQAAPVLNIKL